MPLRQWMAQGGPWLGDPGADRPSRFAPPSDLPSKAAPCFTLLPSHTLDNQARGRYR